MYKIPAVIRQLLDKPPIMVGEDPAEYRQLFELVRADLQPQDLQDWLTVRDIADAEWELLRLRGIKMAIMHAMLPRAMQSLIADTERLLPLETKWVAPLRKHLIGVLAGDQQAKQELDRLLEGFGLTLDVVTATTFAHTITSQVHTERMVAAAYERRNRAYRELERRRAKAAAAPSHDNNVVNQDGIPPVDRVAPTGRANHVVDGKAA
jgi:hypothetical protein